MAPEPRRFQRAERRPPPQRERSATDLTPLTDLKHAHSEHGPRARLLRHGPKYATELLDGLAAWMSRKGFEDLSHVRGLLAVPSEADGAAFERAGYVTAMRAANAGAYNQW